MVAWKTRSRQLIFEQPRWVRVETHEVELPDGSVIPDWVWIKTPDYIDVVVETEEGNFLCFKQRKYAHDDELLAVVGGYVEPGEEPLDAARRELLEETGYISDEWVKLGDYIVDPNRYISTGHLFLARHARRVSDPTGRDLEEQEELFLSRPELEAALDQGEIKVLAWAAVVSFALRKLSG